MTTTDWEQRLAGWLGDLEVGAELEVSDPDGTVVFLAPLARHYRLEPEESVLWVRPIVGGYVPAGEAGLPPYAFHLNEARARAISTEQLSFDGEVLELRNAAGQLARIRPAGPETRPELERWDSFYYLVLNAEEEQALDAVWGDSYYGDWA